MKNKITALILAIIIVVCPLLAACSQEPQPADETLTFYCVNEWDGLVEFLKKYNKLCAIEDRYEDRVELVNFESYEELQAQLSTELMAGKGPDIISLDQRLPFEKLVKNHSLMDINELVNEYGNGFTFDDYNKVVMDSGVFDGKRYLLPLYYRPDYLATTENRAEKFNVDLDTSSYQSLIDDFDKENPEYYLIHPYYAMYFYGSFIMEFVDFENGTTDFDTDEFRGLAESFKDMILYGGSYETYNAYEEGENGDDYLFQSFDSRFGGGSFATVSRIYSYSVSSEEDRELFGIADSEIRLFENYSREGIPSAYVSVGMAINANCKQPDKAMKLIEYLLSFDAQSYWCGGREYESVSSDFNFSGLPVNNEVFEASYNQTIKSDLDVDLNGEIESYDTEIKEKTLDFLQNEYLPLLESIQRCKIYPFECTSTYYIKDVIWDILTEYLKDEISVDKFVSKLSSATELYINE